MFTQNLHRFLNRIKHKDFDYTSRDQWKLLEDSDDVLCKKIEPTEIVDIHAETGQECAERLYKTISFLTLIFKRKKFNLLSVGYGYHYRMENYSFLILIHMELFSFFSFNVMGVTFKFHMQ